MDQTLQEFLGINWPTRSKKPRAEGITMVMDTGWPTTFCESMVAQYGEYLDVVKLWDPHLRAPEKEIRKKITTMSATSFACRANAARYAGISSCCPPRAAHKR